METKQGSERISELILTELAKTGVCNAGLRYLDSTDKSVDVLIKVWKRWPEYFCEHSCLATNTIRTMANDELLSRFAENNLYIDSRGEVALDSDVAVFFVGKSKSTIKTLPNSIIKIYVYNESDIEIEIGVGSKVNIEAYDASKVLVSNGTTENSKVYQYDDSFISCGGTVVKKKYMRGDVFNGTDNYIGTVE